MSTDPDATDKLQPETDGASAPVEKLAGEAGDGLGAQSQRVADYYDARRGGMRDRITQENLPAQPEFFDSRSSSTLNKQNGQAQADDHDGSAPPAAEIAQRSAKDTPIEQLPPPTALDRQDEQLSDNAGDTRAAAQPTPLADSGLSTLMNAAIAEGSTRVAPPENTAAGSDGSHDQQPRFDEPAAGLEPSRWSTIAHEPNYEPAHEPAYVPAHEIDPDDPVITAAHDPVVSDLAPAGGPRGLGHPPGAEDDEHAPAGVPGRAVEATRSGHEPSGAPVVNLEQDDARSTGAGKPDPQTSASPDRQQPSGEAHPSLVDHEGSSASALAVKAGSKEQSEAKPSSARTDQPVTADEKFVKTAFDSATLVPAPGADHTSSSSSKDGSGVGPGDGLRSADDKSQRKNTDKSPQSVGLADGNINTNRDTPPKASESSGSAKVATEGGVKVASAEFTEPRARAIVSDVLKQMKSDTFKPEQLDPHSRRVFDAVKVLSPARLDRLRQMIAGEPASSTPNSARGAESKAEGSKVIADRMKTLAPGESALSANQGSSGRFPDFVWRNKGGHDLGPDTDRSKIILRDLGRLLGQINKELGAPPGGGEPGVKPLLGRSLDLNARSSDRMAREPAHIGKDEVPAAKLASAQQSAPRLPSERGQKPDEQPSSTDKPSGSTRPETGAVPIESPGKVGAPPAEAADGDAIASAGESGDDNLEEKPESKARLGGRHFAGTLECLFFKERRRQYIVQEDDTIESIAAEKLRDAKLAPLILEINQDIIPVRNADGEQIIDLKPSMVIWLPTTADIRYFRAPLGDTPTGEQPRYHSTQAQHGRTLTPEEELAARFGGSPQDYVVNAVEEQRVLSFVQQLDEACRLVRWGKGGEAESTLESRLEVKRGAEEWVPIVSYEIVGETSRRHEFTPDGMRNTIGLNLAPHEVQEMAESDLSHNWQSYASNFRSRTPPID